ncbi:MAG: molybdopterin molybdenumtransferase MoeA, partial [Pseudomonadota bacterium]
MSELTSVNDAWRAIEAAVPRWPVETVRVEHASGRILAEAVAADRDQPPFDRVTMDGIAVASSALTAGR